MNRGPKDSDWPGSNSNGQGPRARVSESTSSAEHRRRLEAMFSSGEKISAPPAGRAPSTERVFSSPRKSTGRAPSEYRLRLERLRMAREVEEIKEAANTFLAHHQLPDDSDILYKVLQHPDEKVVRDALGQISALLMQGRIASTMLLYEHLNTLSGRIQEDATRSYIEGIRDQIAKQQAT